MNDDVKPLGAVDTDLSHLAAEYALGILRGPERAHFEQLMAVNPVLKGFVLKWGGLFGSLPGGESPAPAEPGDESIWARLERRLDVEEKVMTRLHEHQLDVRNSLAVSIGALRVLRDRLVQRRAAMAGELPAASTLPH